MLSDATVFMLVSVKTKPQVRRKEKATCAEYLSVTKPSTHKSFLVNHEKHFNEIPKTAFCRHERDVMKR